MIKLTIDTPVLPILSGNITYTVIASDQIKLSSVYGNFVPNWSPYKDHVFSITINNILYYFYWSSIVFDGTNTILLGIQWTTIPPNIPGNYLTSISFASKIPKFNRTLCTIGDSITWTGYGAYYRSILLDKGLEYDFVGNHTDLFGYQHSAEGGDGTSSVLKRMSSIPFADSYLLLIGLNDRVVYTSQDCFNNILRIVSQLEARGKTVNVCTLLPATVPGATAHINGVNTLLRNNAWRQGTKLIDTNQYLNSLGNWSSMIPDGGHPNLDGYKVMAEYIVSEIN